MEQSMYEMITTFFIGISCGGIGFIIYQYIFRMKHKRELDQKTSRIVDMARSKADSIEKKSEIKAKNLQIKMKKEVEKKIRDEKRKLEMESDRLDHMKSQQDIQYQKKLENLNEKQNQLDKEIIQFNEKSKKLDLIEKQKKEELRFLTQRLEETSQITKSEAEEELKKILEDHVRAEMSSKLKKIEDDLVEESARKSRDILAMALSRHASTMTMEHTTESLPISGDDVKGKIIGREGRNIRSLGNSCGVDILIDEGQDSIMISCFDPVRRDIAKQSILQLIKDGRIHPARIEEVVSKIRSEVFKKIKQEGEKTCFELDIHNVHPEIIQAVGGLKYKMIDGRNALSVSTEIAFLAGHIMSELGGDIKKARRAAFLHLLGLGVDHRIEGHYAQAGAEFAKKYREKPDIVQAILCHNSKVEAVTQLDHVVQSAFNLYKSLSVFKKENIENFVSRMRNIESVANSFSGVIRSFVIRLGKEIRVLVDSSQVTDSQTRMLCSDITKKLERELDHSYQIKVSVLRESRIVEHAR